MCICCVHTCVCIYEDEITISDYLLDTLFLVAMLALRLKTLSYRVLESINYNLRYTT